MSRLFFFLNQHLPTRMRNAILVRHLNIKEPRV